MFGHQSPVPRNNTYPTNSHEESYTTWDHFHGGIYFFGASFLNMDVYNPNLLKNMHSNNNLTSRWSLNLKFGQNWCKFHGKRNNLLWTIFVVNWSHVRTLLAIYESKFPPPRLTSPPPLRALRPPQWERPLCLTNVSIKVVYAHQ